MKSWTDWKDLTTENVSTLPKNAKGVYVIRKKGNFTGHNSDIIYIGQAGTRQQGVDIRLRDLLRDLKSSRDKWRDHAASQKIRKHLKAGLQFSWLESFQSPDGVEKALLLAFKCSTGILPECNDYF